MSEPIQGEVLPADVLFNTELVLRKSLDRDALAAQIDRDVESALARFRGIGVDVTPPGMAEQVRAQLEAQSDGNALVSLLKFDADRRATRADLEQRLAASRLPSAEPNDTRELLLLRKWEGKTLAQAAEAYATSTDPIFQRLVEQERDTLRLSAGENDGEALAQLQGAIRAKQAAREDASLRRGLELLSGAQSMFLEGLIARAQESLRRGTPFEFVRVKRNKHMLGAPKRPVHGEGVAQ